MINTEFSNLKNKQEGYALDSSKDNKIDYMFTYEVYLIVDFVKQTKQLDGIFTNSNYLRPANKNDLKTFVLDEKYVLNTSDESFRKGLIENMNAGELSALLNINAISASGKKKKLQKLALRNIDRLDLNIGEYDITQKGEAFLKEYEWFEIYDSSLMSFDFNDYCIFTEKSSNDNHIEITREYLKKHTENAHKKENFKYLNECIIADAYLSAFEGDLTSQLKGEIREFIWRINPVYDFKEFYEEYLLVDIENIESIKTLGEKLEIKDLKKLFYSIWDKENLKESVTKEEGYKFLKSLLESENIPKECVKFYNDNVLDESKQVTLDFF